MRRHTGEPPVDIGEYTGQVRAMNLAFQSDDVLVVDQSGDFRWLSVPEGRLLRRVEGDRGRLSWPRGDGYFSFADAEGQGSLVWWPFDDQGQRLIGTMPDWKHPDAETEGGDLAEWSAEWSAIDIDPTGAWLAYSRERTVYLRSVEEWIQPPLRLGVHQGNVVELAFHPDGTRVASRDEFGDIKVWSVAADSSDPIRSFHDEGSRQIGFDPTGRWFASHGMAGGYPKVHLWDLSAPQGTEPITLARTDGIFAFDLTFHPRKPWLVTANHSDAGFWPLVDGYPWVLGGHNGRIEAVAFTADGEWLLSAAGADGVRGWPLRGQNGGAPRVLLDRHLVSFTELALHPSGEYFAVGSSDGTVLVAPFDGGPVREMPGKWQVGGGMHLDFSPDGRHLAAIPMWGPAGDMIIRVWNLETGNVRILDPDMGPGPQTNSLYFDDDRRLRWVGEETFEGKSEFGDRVFDLADGGVKKEVIIPGHEIQVPRAVSNDGSFFLAANFGSSDTDEGELVWHSVETGESRGIPLQEDPLWMAIDPSDQWFVTGGMEGPVRVRPITGEEPHLLLGHKGYVRCVAISPDGQWIASGGSDGKVRLWPTPDLSKPPLHTLPHDELITKLESLTNLRVAEDAESPSGWKIDYAPILGWKELPEW